MTPAQYARAKAIFEATCELPAGEQPVKVAEMAAEDEEIRRQVIAMLQQDDPRQGGELPELAGQGEALRRGLEAILRGESGDDAKIGPFGDIGRAVPEFIGQYRVVRRAGSGGMGDVYEAEQETPRRRVAIKLMRSGLESEAMLRRFRREIEFLGRLSHPGIAQVFEAGVATIAGARVPYCVMEFVDGLALSAYVQTRGLSVAAILRLFASICEIVHYAHQQGIIHRDLKPANILVQERFASKPGTRTNTGTSAATSSSHAEPVTREPQTSWGADDALPRILDFGIARAVESGKPGLATVATEAGQIFGTMPYMSPEQFSGAASDVDTRSDVYALGVIIFELLTGNLPHATDGLSLLQASRLKAESPPLRLWSFDRTLRGDLDTIVAKALDPDKNRRYPSASELGADIRRYLSFEVITARPATLGYQARQFARRNLALVSASSVAVLALIAGIIATSVQTRSAIHARDLAQQKTRVAEDVTSVLLEAFSVATPKGGSGVEPKLLDAIERIESRSRDTASTLSPEAVAVVLNISGITWRERGNLERAERNFQESLDIRRRVLAPGDPNLADSLNNMGLLRRKQGKDAEAAVFMQAAVDLQTNSTFRDDRRLARNVYNLASAYIAAGELAKAKPLLDRSLEMHRVFLGPEEEIIGIHLAAKAKLAGAEGRWTDASAVNVEAIALFRKAVGPSHPSLAVALSDQSGFLTKLGDTVGAIAASTEADAMAHALFAVEPPHPIVKAIREQLIIVLRQSGQNELADRLAADITAMPVVPSNSP